MKNVLSFREWSINETFDPKAANAVKKPASGSATSYVNSAISISDKIKNLFLNTSFWAQFKGTFNDDESSALTAFNTWWTTNITPTLSKIPSSDVNYKTLSGLQAKLQEALLGSSWSDTVSWTISGSQGMSKNYSVDTDF
jgi:hypothetical protein